MEEKKNRNISQKTLKLLFANSGNVCTNPKCDIETVSDYDIIGEMAHIYGLNKKSARFDENKTIQELNSEYNLLVLCPTCHKIVDKRENDYPAELLIDWKKQRLELLKNKKWILTSRIETLIQNEFKSYWSEIDTINNKYDFNEIPKYKVKRVKNIKEIDKIFQNCVKYLNEFSNYLFIDLEKIEKDIVSILNRTGANLDKYNEIPYYENPFYERNGEMLTFGLGNFIINSENNYKEILIYLYEKELKLDPENENLQKGFQKLKKQLTKIAKDSHYIE